MKRIINTSDTMNAALASVTSSGCLFFAIMLIISPTGEHTKAYIIAATARPFERFFINNFLCRKTMALVFYPTPLL